MREPGDWMSGRVLLGVYALLAGLALSFYALWRLGLFYAAFFVPTAVVFLPLQRRWGLPSVSYLVFAVAWPAGFLWLPYVVVVQERLRRERIVREIMEA